MFNPLIATATMHGAASIPKNYPGLKVEELSSFLWKTFPGEKEFEDEKNLTLRNPISNHAEGVRDGEDRGRAIGRQSSTRSFQLSSGNPLSKQRAENYRRSYKFG